MYTQQLHQGQLHTATCPHCHKEQPIGHALLFHDRQARCVVFAVPHECAEHLWHDQARELHALLVERLPVDQRLPYLNDVHIAHDLAGIARVHTKARRRYSTTSSPQQHATHEPARIQETRESYEVVAEPATQPTKRESDLYETIQQLLTAPTQEAVVSLIERTPRLLEPQTDQVLRDLANTAFEQRDYESVECLLHIRQTLTRMRTQDRSQNDTVIPSRITTHETVSSPTSDTLSGAYYALLYAASQLELHNIVQSYPDVLEPWFDDVLEEEWRYALADGYERLALILVHRYELVSELR